MHKIIVPYKHDPANLQPIFMAVTNSKVPSPDSWKAAFRDTVDGKRVIWARFPGRRGAKVNLWVRDNSGDRLYSTVTL